MKGGVQMRHFKCYDCGHEWDVPHGPPRPVRCPNCQSANIHRGPYCRGGGFRGGGRRRRRP